MHIPRIWTRIDGQVSTPDRGVFPVVVWGWGEDEAEARREGEGRLGRLSERIRRGEPFPRGYEYGSRPIREEILQVIGTGAEPRAVLTRNRYGATVMNATHLLFLDVDLPEEGSGLSRLIGKLFGRKDDEASALGNLRAALTSSGKGSFRIYRTAGGFRVIATGRDFDPAGAEAQALMKATATDRCFVRLCLAQKSFRARLTPKPWRAGVGVPPGEYPRDGETRQAFAKWLAEYEQASQRFATCRFLETVGPRMVGGGGDAELVELHDRATRAAEALPLA